MNGKKPTRAQRRIIEAYRLNTHNWLVQKDTSEILQLVHRYTNTVRILKKRGRV